MLNNLTRPAVMFSPIRTAKKKDAFNLGELVDRAVGAELQDGDVLVISSKFIAISEGRVVDLASVMPSARSVSMAKRLNISPELCELAIRESDEVIGWVTGFMLTLKEGLLTPNAGIDKSNVERGKVVLYPRDPLESAMGLVDALWVYSLRQVAQVVLRVLACTTIGTIGGHSR